MSLSAPRLFIVILMLALASCGGPKLGNVSYDRPGSVNGLEALRALFASRAVAGEILESKTINATIEECDVIVYAPNPEEIDWTTLNISHWAHEWYSGGSERTLVVLVPDTMVTSFLCDRWSKECYQAGLIAERQEDQVSAEAFFYQSKLMSNVAEQHRHSMLENYVFAQLPYGLTFDSSPVVPVDRLESDPEFATHIQTPAPLMPSLRFQVEGVSAEEATILLEDSSGPMIVSIKDRGGRMILTTTSSALVDGGIVDPGSRQLAKALVDYVVPEGEPQKIGWLRSNFRGLEDPPPMPSFFGMLLNPTWAPLVIQLALLAVVALVARRFFVGRRGEVTEDGHLDFDRHLGAYGRLLLGRRGADHVMRTVGSYHHIDCGDKHPPSLSEAHKRLMQVNHNSNPEQSDKPDATTVREDGHERE